MNITISSHQQLLTDTAKALVNQGFSVIPVHGNHHKSQPKKPATQWKKYQKNPPKTSEIDLWYSRKLTAIGIVCGLISNLMVIDFDDHLTYSRFVYQFPQFCDTYTVKTQRGYHLYYRIYQKIQTHHFDGGDIQAEKSYVIAPPSLIGDYQYTAISTQDRITLFPQDIDEIFDFLHIDRLNNQQSKPIEIPRKKLNLQQLYNNLCNELGRNNALYRAASIACRGGISQDHVELELMYHHISQPTPPNHKHESDKDRYREAQRTIKSAYSSHSMSHSSAGGLPNAIRETLLQTQHSTILPRLLDIFALNNWSSGTQFTMQEAIIMCVSYGLNRKSVMKALTGDLSVFNGQYIIIRRNAEYHDIRGLNFCTGGRRPELLFEVPSIDYLLQVLEVSWSPSDKIAANDVKSAHVYRLALHREYIKRLSPTVPMGWLANRLGVDVRTIQRYNRELDVQITQNLGCFTLAKSNLDSLPKRHSKITKNATNGFWLETEDGNRYPAWRHIGSQLLKLHPNGVTVCVQKASKLMFFDEPVVVEPVAMQAITPSEFIKLQAFRSCAGDRPSLVQVVDNLFVHVKKRLNRVRYFNFQLHFDTVIGHIAKDKVAETISCYLFAFDDEGNKVIRPAKRGIAYRMLKEFGNGNVYLALLDIETEMFYSLARHAMRFGYASAAMKYLLSALD